MPAKSTRKKKTHTVKKTVKTVKKNTKATAVSPDPAATDIKAVKPVTEVKPAAKKVETKAEAKPATKKVEAKPAAKKAETKAETKPAAKKAENKVEAKPAAKKAETKVEAKPAETKVETKVEAKPVAKKAETKVEAKPAAKKVETKVEAKPAAKKAEIKVEAKPAEKKVETKVETKPAEKKAEVKVEAKPVEEKKEEPVKELPQPRRSVAFIGSECYPFVKTGGLGDVMYALPKELAKQNCDVKVILPRYACIPEKYQEKMVYRGSFDMNLCSDGRSFYVGIMEYVWDGVVYDFIDNQEFFTNGNPYTNLIDDIPKFCYFSKAALAALNYMDWEPDVIHCHDWQAALVPVYLDTMFKDTPIGGAKTVLTIHNLRFQGIYDKKMISYWTGLPDYVFNKDALTVKWLDANMLKGGLTYADAITTVSGTYAWEIQTPEYGEDLDAHLRYHSGKLRGIVNGIDYDIWNPATDPRLANNYDLGNVLTEKRKNKKALQEELGLEVDDGKFVIGLVSRLTNQKGLDLVNEILPQLIDGNTQVVILGTGDAQYEDSFRYYENAYRGQVCSNIMYDETRAHHIYAGADALLVPSRFEPCGLTQLIAMHYGDIPIVRETGGLKDTVEPYNEYTNWGNGFTFDRYESGLLLDAVNRAKTLYFTNRWCWDEMVQRNMDKDVSWESSARQYRDLYVDLTR